MITTKQAKQVKTTYNIGKLLSPGATNFKTAKNKKGVTFIMYVAPADQNDKGVNLCSNASEGCIKACLFTAGRGSFDNVKSARINKANFYVNDKFAFLVTLAHEIMCKIKYYSNKDTVLYFRLNGTSDVDFLGQIKRHLGIDFLTFDNVVFYDYTAILGKVKKYMHTDNYFHAFSRKEDNEQRCLDALALNNPVAAVFSGALPKTYKGYPVINGDMSDIEMIEFKNKAVWLGLTAKGKAKKDKTGFVITDY